MRFTLRRAILLIIALTTVVMTQGLNPSCGTSQYYDGLNCRNCPIQCRTCTSASYCNSCASGYYLSYGRCLSCTSYCVSCNSGTCTACASGYKLTNGSCKAQSTDSTRKVADGGIAGIVIGGVVYVGIILCIICCCIRKPPTTTTTQPVQMMGSGVAPVNYGTSQQGYAPAQGYNPSPMMGQQSYNPPPMMGQQPYNPPMMMGVPPPQQGGWNNQGQMTGYPAPPQQPAGFGYANQAPNGAPLPPGFINNGAPMGM